MSSEKQRIPPREEQYIRFVDTVREIGNETAIGELDEMLIRMVPPTRAGEAGSRQAAEDLFHQASNSGPGNAPESC